jgi:hypothetical protein
MCCGGLVAQMEWLGIKSLSKCNDFFTGHYVLSQDKTVPDLQAAEGQIRVLPCIGLRVADHKSSRL